MSGSVIASTVELFSSRLTTLEHLLNTGASHCANEGGTFLNRRLAADMHPLGTQIAFTCNQPRNFSLWLRGSAADDLNPNVDSLRTALGHIHETKRLLAGLDASDAVLASAKRLELGGGLYADLTGHQYLNDFLVPNFYFHLVTTYAILRMSGVPIGKRDYMLHLVPYVKHVA